MALLLVSVTRAIWIVIGKVAVGYLLLTLVGFGTRAFYCLVLLLLVLFSGKVKDLKSARKLEWTLVVVGITNFALNSLGL